MELIKRRVRDYNWLYKNCELLDTDGYKFHRPLSFILSRQCGMHIYIGKEVTFLANSHQHGKLIDFKGWGIVEDNFDTPFWEEWMLVPLEGKENA